MIFRSLLLSAALALSAPANAAIVLTGSGTLSGPTFDFGDPGAVKAGIGLQAVNTYSFHMVIDDFIFGSEETQWYVPTTDFDFLLNGVSVISSATLGSDFYVQTRYQGVNFDVTDLVFIGFVRTADLLPEVAGLENIAFSVRGIWPGDTFAEGQSYTDFANFGPANVTTEFSLTNGDNGFSYVVETRGAPYPVQSAVVAVPEPATWATMLLGFGLIGGAMRVGRRKTLIRVSYA